MYIVGMSDVHVVKHRKGISSSQVSVLELLCKFRFASIELLVKSLNLKTVPGLRRKLKMLVEQGYAGIRYDRSYKIKGKPAAYYITAKGLKALRDLPGHDHIDERFIKSCYRDKTIKEEFINQHLILYRASHELKRLYPDIKFFTRRDLIPYTHFPADPPGAFLALKAEGQADTKRFFLDIIPDSMPRYLLDGMIARYVEYFEAGGWDVTESELPTMLLLCESVTTEKRVIRQAAKKLQSLHSDEPKYLTSTIHALRNATRNEKNIWSDVDDPDELMTLAEN